MKIILQKKLYFLIISFIFFSCAASGVFDQNAFDQASAIKVYALSLMEKAINPYPDLQTEVDSLKEKLNQAYEYSKTRVNNDEETKQWEIILDPNRNSLAGFLKRWEAQTQLNEQFINGAKNLVSDGFDTIIDLENSKR